MSESHEEHATFMWSNVDHESKNKKTKAIYFMEKKARQINEGIF